MKVAELISKLSTLPSSAEVRIQVFNRLFDISQLEAWEASQGATETAVLKIVSLDKVPEPPRRRVSFVDPERDQPKRRTILERTAQRPPATQAERYGDSGIGCAIPVLSFAAVIFAACLFG